MRTERLFCTRPGHDPNGQRADHIARVGARLFGRWRGLSAVPERYAEPTRECRPFWPARTIGAGQRPATTAGSLHNANFRIKHPVWPIDDRLFCVFIHRHPWGDCPHLPRSGLLILGCCQQREGGACSVFFGTAPGSSGGLAKHSDSLPCGRQRGLLTARVVHPHPVAAARTAWRYSAPSAACIQACERRMPAS